MAIIHPGLSVITKKFHYPSDQLLPLVGEFSKWIEHTPEGRRLFEKFCKDNKLDEAEDRAWSRFRSSSFNGGFTAARSWPDFIDFPYNHD